MNTRALVLDFGGVMSRTLYETHDLTEEALGLKEGTLKWRGPFDLESDPLYVSMQAGEISERDYWHYRTRETASLVGADWNAMSDFVIAARGAEPDKIMRPEAVMAIHMVKRAGMKLAILSNELDLFYGRELRGKLPLLEDFNLVVDATHTNILKPDPRAYAAICDGLELEPGDCVFVDDQLKNIQGGRQFGMQCVHFDITSPKSGFNEALELLGLGKIQ